MAFNDLDGKTRRATGMDELVMVVSAETMEYEEDCGYGLCIGWKLLASEDGRSPPFDTPRGHVTMPSGREVRDPPVPIALGTLPLTIDGRATVAEVHRPEQLA